MKPRTISFLRTLFLWWVSFTGLIPAAVAVVSYSVESPTTWASSGIFPLTVSRTDATESVFLKVDFFLDRGNGYEVVSGGLYGGTLSPGELSGVFAIDLPAVSTTLPARIDVTLNTQRTEHFLTLVPAQAASWSVSPDPHEAAKGYLTGTLVLSAPAQPGGVFVSFRPDEAGVQITRIEAGSALVVPGAGDTGFYVDGRIRIPEGETTATVRWLCSPRVNTRARTFFADFLREGSLESVSATASLAASVDFSTLDLTFSPAEVKDGQTVEITVTVPQPAPAPGLSAEMSFLTPDQLEQHNRLPKRSRLFIPAGQTSATYRFTAHNSGTKPVDYTTKATFGFSDSVASEWKTLRVQPANLEVEWWVVGGDSLSFYADRVDPVWVEVELRIDQAAPNGGYSFLLEHDLTAGLGTGWPRTVTIPQGQSYALVEIELGPISTEVTGHLRVTPQFAEASPGDPVEIPLSLLLPYVHEPNQVALTLSQSVFTADDLVTITLGLARPAPAGGAVVQLTGDVYNLKNLPLDRLFIIPEGQSSLSATFEPFCHPDVVNGTMTANYDGTSAAANFTHNPLAYVPEVKISRESGWTLRCDRPALYRVDLSIPAPVGGAVVPLGAHGAAVPDSVTVAEGETFALFPVRLLDDPDWIGHELIYATMRCSGDEVPPLTATAGDLALDAFSLSVETVVGPTTLTGTLVLNQAAPSGGVVVPIAVAPNDFATAPGYVLISEGETSATFTVEVGAPGEGSVQIVTVNVALCEVLSDSVEVQPPTPLRLIDLTVNPHSVLGGETSTGTVTLNQASPAGGTDVALKVYYPGAVVPPSVTVPAGRQSADFPINTYTTCTQEGQVLIEASLGADVLQKPLTILSPLCGTLSGVVVQTAPGGGVPAGSANSARVELDGVAPGGGLSVKVAFDDPRIQSEAVATIPAGASGVDVDFVTPDGCVEAPVRLEVSLGAQVVETTFRITHPDCVRLTDFVVAPRVSSNGEVLRATVSIDQPAPIGGVVISLGNPSGRLLELPATVRIPVGAVFLEFEIPTRLSEREDRITVTASLGGTTLSALLDFGPTTLPEFTAFSFAPTVAAVGETISGRLELSGVAPTGGLTLALEAPFGGGLSGLPTSVEIPAGQNFATFTCTPTAAALGQRLEVTARYFFAPRTVSVVVVAATGGVPFTFDDWKEAFFSIPELADPQTSGAEADADQQGVPNYLRYALGWGRDLAGRTDSPAWTVDGSGQLWLRFAWPKGAASVVYRLERSTNLVDWTEWVGAGGVVRVERDTFYDWLLLPISAEGVDGAYFRVAVDWIGD